MHIAVDLHQERKEEGKSLQLSLQKVANKEKRREKGENANNDNSPQPQTPPVLD